MARIYSWLKKFFVEDEQMTRRVAILASVPAPAMDHYLERLSAYLATITDKPIEPVVYSAVDKRENFEEFVYDYQQKRIHGVIGLDCLSSRALVFYAQQAGMGLPSLLVGCQGKLPAVYPSNFRHVPVPNLMSRIAGYLRVLYPRAQNCFFICSQEMVEKNLPYYHDFVVAMERANITVFPIECDNSEKSIASQVAANSSLVDFAYFNFEVVVFGVMNEMKDSLRGLGISCVASNLYSLHHGFDCAIGFPESTIMRGIALKMINLLDGVEAQPEGAEFCELKLEIHCNMKRMAQYREGLARIHLLFGEFDVSVHLHADSKARR